MNIQYILKRSRKRKKTISLQIGGNSEVLVFAPYFTPKSEINRFVEEKQSWIDRTVIRQFQLQNLRMEKTYATGDKLYYLGQAYPLEAYDEPLENEGITFWKERFFLNCPPNPAKQKAYLTAWYKKKALAYLSERVADYENLLKLKSCGLKINSATGRWGSCSSDNRLNFCFRLMMAPPRVIDYVIVHELMHIHQKNHSAVFWNLVGQAMPDYPRHKRWLREHQHELHL